MKTTTLCAAIAAAHLLLAAAAAADPPPWPRPTPTTPAAPPSTTPAPTPATATPSGEVVVIQGETRVTPGSAHIIESEELERHERDDIHHILSAVPGVYVREEDGYGLRPNIGMRGAGSDRSSKITLMEDGVLIAPAPYSAPAAYYMPLVTRMTQIEVLKGPAAIQHGPNTVGGAINLVSRPVPFERAAEIDAALGGDGYGKLHGAYGERWRRGGVLLEGVGLRSSGFKELDGGGDTGFARRDLLARGLWNTDPDRPRYQEIGLKVGFADETSHETYLGLTDADLHATPYRRYAGSQRDRMKWRHWQLQASHRLERVGPFDLTTTAYHLRFDRTWKKLNGFDTERTLNEILANPDVGNNAVLYQVLTGQADSASPSETLLLGENARDFTSQGVQMVGHVRGPLLAFDHELEAGVRLHMDRARRHHTEESYLMVGGDLMRDERPEGTTRDETGRATALALHVQDRARWRGLTVTAGLRTELIATELDDRLQPELSADESYAVFIPGAGAFYEIGPWLGVLAGVHKGFVPVAPGQGDLASPEESINYEAGARLARGSMTAELIGFFNDYSNLGGVCTLAIGCSDQEVDAEFDGGRVHVYGLEAAARAEPGLGGRVWFPLSAAYTLTRSGFRESFSSGNPEWGDVEAGFELPYLPRHQLAVSAAARTRTLELAVSARHVGAMRDVAGDGPLDGATATEPATVFDLAAHVLTGSWGETYLTVQNLTDEAHVAARRPFGARPGIPRLIVIGYKNRFF
ncbi:MAG TPA: TonB-dependent receptor [Kofleriaceae bacterium]|nr:TonB-dependent receptor [Kofleriaceae bacterium]